ncbi:hypothetical protein D3C71_1771760 [compost metagenome]
MVRLEAIGRGAVELLGGRQAIEQRVPVQSHLQLTLRQFADAYVVDLVQGARQGRGGGRLAGAQAEHPVFQARAVGVVDQ